MAEDKEQELIDAGIAPEIIEEKLAESKPVDESTPPPPPEMLFKRLEFHNIPGVALIVPDATPLADLIRISGKVQVEIGLMVMRQAMDAVMGL